MALHQKNDCPLRKRFTHLESDGNYKGRRCSFSAEGYGKIKEYGRPSMHCGRSQIIILMYGSSSLGIESVHDRSLKSIPKQVLSEIASSSRAGSIAGRCSALSHSV